MENGLQSTLANLATEDPARNVEAIKTAVANYLREADESLAIEATQYFNHSFAPDLVLNWTGQTSGSRQVFIRTDSREDSLLDDLGWLASDAPLLLPLAELVPPQVGAEDVPLEALLDQAALRRDAMVATPSSLEELRSPDHASVVSRLFTQAVVRGGRGLLDENRARSASRTVELGYEGAQSSNVDSTQAAVQSIESLVRLGEAAAITRLLQAVWIGGGGSEFTFPGATGVSGPLTVDSLQFLLDLGEVGDDDFWGRVASRLQLSDIVRLTVAPESQRFQTLMQQALPRLRGRGFAATDDGNPFLQPYELRWYARQGHLGLQASDFRVGFVAELGSLTSVGPARDVDGLGIRVLLDRLDQRDLSFAEMKFLASSGAELSFRPAVPSGPSDDSLLVELTDPLENNAIAVSVAVTMSSGREIFCDLQTSRAQGRTGAKFHLTEMIHSALPLVQPISEERLHWLGLGLDSPAVNESDGDVDD